MGDGGDQFARAGLPNSRASVGRCGDNSLSIGTEQSTPDLIAMLEGWAHWFARLSVPDTGSVIVGRSNNPSAIRAEVCRANRGRVLERRGQGPSGHRVPNPRGHVF
jgi:hypothetical protein